eukprot:2473229-Alexandrium_andersonii.AAC.1
MKLNRGATAPSGPPRRAPPARATSPGGLPPPRTPLDWRIRRARGANRGGPGGSSPPGEVARAGGANRG